MLGGQGTRDAGRRHESGTERERREGEISTELEGFLQLVAGSTNCAEGTFAARVQSQVVKARQNARWRKEFMDWEMTLRHEREKGREEGRQEERANTERERKRADEAQAELQQEKQRADQYQTEVDRLRRLLAEHGVSDVSNGASQEGEKVSILLEDRAVLDLPLFKQKRL